MNKRSMDDVAAEMLEQFAAVRDAATKMLERKNPDRLPHKEVDDWMKTPNAMLQNNTPTDAIVMGQFDVVMNLITLSENSNE